MVLDRALACQDSSCCPYCWEKDFSSSRRHCSGSNLEKVVDICRGERKVEETTMKESDDFVARRKRKVKDTLMIL